MMPNTEENLVMQSCALQPNGSYTKDLSLVEEDLSRVCFMDNSPVSYNWNKGKPIRFRRANPLRV